MADDLQSEPPLRAGTWHAVAAARAALARLDQCSLQVPEPTLLLRPNLGREAQSTSALEGIYAPLEDVLATPTAGAPSSAELTEVFNYWQAAEFAYEWVRQRGGITVGLLEQVHGLLVANTRSDGPDAGRVRTTQVVIGSLTGGVEDARFVPMPPGPPLHAGLNALIDWMRGPGNDSD